MFVDGVKQRNADVLDLLLGPFLEMCCNELSLHHFDFFQREQLTFLLLLKIAKQSNNAGDCLCLILFVLQQDLDGRQLEVRIYIKDATKE